MTSIHSAVCRIFCKNFKRYYLKNGRLFQDFLLKFWNVREIYNVLKKRMSVLAYLFIKLLFRKEVATKKAGRSCFRTPFGNQRANGFQTPLEVARHHYYPFLPWIPCKVSWKKTALLWLKILKLFATTLTADDKYSCRNMQKFLQQLQTLLYEKRKAFSGFFYSISEMWIKFRTFWKKGWVS